MPTLRWRLLHVLALALLPGIALAFALPDTSYEIAQGGGEIAGFDTIDGGTGFDILRGSSGDDVFSLGHAPVGLERIDGM